jgi:DNA sulfur modification protein DndC
MLLQSIEATRLALIDNPNAHWVIGFSGGKDSSAVIKIFLAAYRKLKNPSLKISLVYCDTGVENIVLDNYVKGVLRNLQFEFEAKKIPIRVTLLEAPVFSRFFVRIIGRGYPPPTIDRQATDRTRAKAILVLGLRRNESQQRDRSLKNVRDVYWEKLRLGHCLVDVFTPIIEFSLEDVWDTIFFLDEPTSIVAAEIERIYRGASGPSRVLRGPRTTATQTESGSSGRCGLRGSRPVRSPRLWRKIRNWCACPNAFQNELAIRFWRNEAFFALSVKRPVRRPHGRDRQ